MLGGARILVATNHQDPDGRCLELHRRVELLPVLLSFSLVEWDLNLFWLSRGSEFLTRSSVDGWRPKGGARGGGGGGGRCDTRFSPALAK